jgi:hypothetical protein
MHGEDLKMYINDFNTLIALAKWDPNEQRTLLRFKDGLKWALREKIIDFEATLPDTLKGWQDVALRRQGRWIEARATSGDRPGQNFCQHLAAALGRYQQDRQMKP